jgi:peptidoglycan/xylan/chitin deacetylase (PgdA/CDA1 family)
MNTKRFVASIAHGTQVDAPQNCEGLFLNWNEAAEMVRGGMRIGSHTCTHPLLSSLTEEEQFREMDESRRIIEARLKVPCETIAYPFGLEHHINAGTGSACERSGYRAGFSFYGGINRRRAVSPSDVWRVPVNAGVTRARFRLQLAGSAVSGRFWI